MRFPRKNITTNLTITPWRSAITIIFGAISFATTAQSVNELPDTIPLGQPLTAPAQLVEDEFQVKGDSVEFMPVDTIPIKDAIDMSMAVSQLPDLDENGERRRMFNPDPNRAVWLSALFPGLGQVYNRRYWKLPLVVGGFMGLGYATSWNSGMLNDYTRAYRDLMDTDPSTNSYMNFFPSTTNENDLDKKWLENILKSRKNYFRRNRDLCIICMIGVYFLAMVDAYVDASLCHFDISDNLTMDWAPTLIPNGYERGYKPSIGLQWAFRF